MFDVLATGSKGNCYVLTTGEEKLLIECGITWKNILKGLNFDLSNIKGCLCSHIHKDHSKALKEVLTNGIDCYASKETFNGLDGNRVHHIESEKGFKIGGFTIMPLKAEHDVECLAFLIYHKEIGKLLFLTDSYYCKYAFKDLDHIMIECNYDDKILPELPPYETRLLKSHMSFSTCKKTLKDMNLSNCKDITLIHLSSRHGDGELFKEEIEKLTGIKTYIAEPGLIVG